MTVSSPPHAAVRTPPIFLLVVVLLARTERRLRKLKAPHENVRSGIVKHIHGGVYQITTRTSPTPGSPREDFFNSVTTIIPPSTPLGRLVPLPTTPSPHLSAAPTPQTPTTPSAPPTRRAALPTLLEQPEDSQATSPSSPSDSPPSTRPPSPSETTQQTFLDAAPDLESDDDSMPTGHEEDRLAAIGPVNAGNWKDWLEALTGCLEMLGFDKAMDEAKLVAPDAVGTYSTENINFRRALKEWTKDTASTIDIIHRHSGSVNTVYLTKGDTPKKWLENLKTVYDVENVMDGAFLVEAFFAAKYTGGSLTEWLSRFAELAEKVNVRYESSIPANNKRTIFDRILRDSIIIRIGPEWRKELGDVKSTDTTADVVGVLTRKYDFHVTNEKRDEDQALLVSTAVAASAASALVVNPIPSKGTSNSPNSGRGKSKLAKALEDVAGALYKLFVGWVNLVLTSYKIKIHPELLKIRFKDTFCGEGWLGGKKGPHATVGNGKWTRKPVAGKDGKVVGGGENHGYIARDSEEDIFAAGDSDDEDALFAGSLTYTETQLQAFDLAATVYEGSPAQRGSFEEDDIWLTFGCAGYVGGPHFGEEEGESDEMPGLLESDEESVAEEPARRASLSDPLPTITTIPHATGTALADAYASTYPPFDVANAYLHARLDHSAYRAPHPPFNTMPAAWAAEVALELERLGARTGKDFAYPAGLTVGDFVRAIWDSGANRHYWSLFQYLHDYVRFDSPRNIGGAFGSVGVAEGSGTLKAVFTLDDGTLHAVAIKDVYYTPGLGANLISAGQLFKQGVLCLATRTRVTLMHDNSVPFGYVNINENGTMLLQASFDTPSPGAATPAPLGPRIRLQPRRWEPSGRKLSLQA
ncbi:hypothetical protein P7C70_g8167, partial [Phenoliferia sp. Uapishka_3]